ncbi:arginine N-succinyltransferase [Ketobacter sp.]|uniref:arginine N-succinyltransferase n=1 Tax=Ketobacter sp. TaxID=2083498 RepID=UPI000F10E7B2|nr:arginine N-succinyltransferase [Ketobacter sp.]RLT97004.1 MAG: arginine N-succinyltransferase [Ketobacter sp.]
MLVVRLAQRQDLQAIVELAQSTGGGLTNLPPDEATLSRKLSHAVTTHQNLTAHGDGLFWFVLEDTASKKLVGVSGIECAIGMDQACYTYRVSTIVHASKTLDVYHQFPTLFLTSDHSGASELCSLYLHPRFRHSKAGALLSKCRFLFMAQYPELFADKVIAELRGYLDEDGTSPFWEGLGRHFFDMEFSQADYLTALNQKQFIAELMPRYPFYTRFLPDSARAVIGKVHRQTEPARKLLEHEGFRYEGCVDIFDAGPTLECYVNRVRAIRDSYLASRLQVEALQGYPLLVCNPNRTEFRCSLLMPDSAGRFPVEVAQLWSLLQLAPTEKARCIVLYREASQHE